MLDIFEAKFRFTMGCWEWLGEKTEKGYGRLTIKKKHYRAHRLSYGFYVGDIPEGLLVCHHCDNPGCVNPSHLFIGTDMDNVHDMIKKGRHPTHKVPRFGVIPSRNRGIQAAYKKRAESIAALYGKGISAQVIADNFGVCRRTVFKIFERNRKNG